MLDKIVKNKLMEIELLKADKKYSLNQHSIVNPQKRGFQVSLLNKIQMGHNAIIAELKKFSPSKGALKEDLDVASFAKLYEQSGAACISVLTDQKFFHGSTDDLIIAKKSVDIPILRKDFILHETQIVQSKLLGADCILLIVACLSETRFGELLNISAEEVQKDRVSSIKNIAKKYNAHVILKGNGTLIASNDIDGIFICSEGGPELASGGTGDVLAGILSSLIAQGMGILDSCILAVAVHSRAGKIFKQDTGEIGLNASSLISISRDLLNE